MADQSARGEHAPTRPRVLEWLPWLALALVVTVLAGFPGHLVPWFSGDLAYHLAVSRTVSLTDLSGDGPYAGLPSYYGGLLPVVLQLLHTVTGASPEHLLAVLSWAEPAAWVGAAAVLARAVWSGHEMRQLAFAVVLLLAVGNGSGALAVGVNAPNVASQAFWPLYPRDLAIMATLVAIGCALRHRWLLAGVVTAVATVAEAQIAVLTCVLLSVVLLLDDRPGRVRRWLLSGVVVGVLSSWWWVPRVVWVASWGTSTGAREFTGDVPHHLGSVLDGFGLLVALAALAGLALTVRDRGGRGEQALLAWFAVALLAVVAGLAVPSELLTLRRSLLLASVPVAAFAAVALDELAGLVARRLGRQGVRWAVAGVAVLAVLAPGLTTYADTRSAIASAFTGETVAQYAYPDDDWEAVWRKADDGGTVLAPSRDAAVVWFRTSRPVAGGLLPGYVKAWFDLDRATGWGQDDRLAAVRGAFDNDPGRLCEVMEQHDLARVLVRSEKGLLGTLDVAGSEELGAHLDPTGRGPDSDADPDGPLSLAAGDRLVLDADASEGLRRLRVWRSGGSTDPGLEVSAGQATPTFGGARRDGLLTTYDLELPDSGGPVVLTATRAVPLLRVVGFRPDTSHSDSTDTGPATVRTRDQACGA